MTMRPQSICAILKRNQCARHQIIKISYVILPKQTKTNIHNHILCAVFLSILNEYTGYITANEEEQKNVCLFFFQSSFNLDLVTKSNGDGLTKSIEWHAFYGIANDNFDFKLTFQGHDVHKIAISINHSQTPIGNKMASPTEIETQIMRCHFILQLVIESPNRVIFEIVFVRKLKHWKTNVHAWIDDEMW